MWVTLRFIWVNIQITFRVLENEWKAARNGCTSRFRLDTSLQCYAKMLIILIKRIGHVLRICQIASNFIVCRDCISFVRNVAVYNFTYNQILHEI